MVASDHTSSSVEPCYQIIFIQDAKYRTDCVSDQLQGLVCHNSSQGRILPRIAPSSTEKVPEVCFRWRSIPISGSSLQAITFTKCVDAASAPLTLQGIRILNYIDDWMILIAGDSASRCRLFSNEKTGIEAECLFKKSVFSPAQRTTYFGIIMMSVSCSYRFHAHRHKGSERKPMRVYEVW